MRLSCKKLHPREIGHEDDEELVEAVRDPRGLARDDDRGEPEPRRKPQAREPVGRLDHELRRAQDQNRAHAADEHDVAAHPERAGDAVEANEVAFSNSSMEKSKY